MKMAHRILAVAALAVVLLAAGGEEAAAQRARTVSDPEGSAPVANTMPAPQAVKVKYEGGIFGYNKKLDGTLSFDDVNQRLIFREKDRQQAMFFIPYRAILAASADTQSRRPTGATVAGSALPYGLGIPALFIKKKYRYLSLQYRDPDTQAAGLTSFKMENKNVLTSMLNTLAGKAGLTQRGDVFVRRTDSQEATTTPASKNDPQPTSPK